MALLILNLPPAGRW